MSRMSANRRARRLIGSAAIASALALGSLAGSAVSASAANGLPAFTVFALADLTPGLANGLSIGTQDANGVDVEDEDANGVKTLPTPEINDTAPGDSTGLANGV